MLASSVDLLCGKNIIEDTGILMAFDNMSRQGKPPPSFERAKTSWNMEHVR